MRAKSKPVPQEPKPVEALPVWVRSPRPETLEEASFLVGAALSALDRMIANPDVPHALLRDRLALGAATACAQMSGRPERNAELRDEVHLLRPGDLPGPGGAVYLQWRHAVARPVSEKQIRKAVSAELADGIAVYLNAGSGTPLGQAAMVLEAVLADHPREEPSALILGDAVLARALGWDYVLPLFAAGLKPRDLRKTGDELRLACHLAVLASAREVLPLAADLTRRAARLRLVAPKLRAKGAAGAVEQFLSRDAVAPSLVLTAYMSDRAARRLCDRLLSLEALRELTGRDTFRLYGL